MRPACAARSWKTCATAPFPKHRLHLNSYLRGARGQLIAAGAARELGIPPPELFALPDALPALSRTVGDQNCPLYGRVAAADGIENLAEFHPEARVDCIAELERRLAWHERNDPTPNGFLIG